ncbi:hypothetical protein PUMCH_004596 [Australozyma saopauloensis]|uniref:Kinase n=1 Tax=Australozyma saopauloensis TaxID=291208 RepID=A0AAX4HFJ0_9ASCO|nr:hypothetical protein PUMCH_004596 [[Candida] saopauloensis]
MKFTPSPHQAAGHAGILEAGPVFAKLTAQQEIDFYAEARSRLDDSLDLGANLYDWMPTFMGTLTQGAVNSPDATVINPDQILVDQVAEQAALEEKYIVLQNLLYGYKNPCILDIKLGAVLVDDTVSEEKRLRLAKVSAETTSGSLHLRVCGMKVYNGQSDEKPPLLDETIAVESTDSGKYLKFNKFFGRSLTIENIQEGLSLFFVKSIAPELRKALITTFYQRLQLFYNCLVDAEVRIKSGSLFFCYDADPARWDQLQVELYGEQDRIFDEGIAGMDDESDAGSDDETNADCPLSRLKFIDFAHSKFTDGQGCDENVIVGVENLLKIFEQLLQ